MIVCGYPIVLCSRLVMIGRPIFSGIEGNLSPSIIGNDHPLIILWCNPKIVVVAMRRIVGLKCFSSIF